MNKDEKHISLNSSEAKLSSGNKYTFTYDTRLKVRVVDCAGEPQADCEYTLTAGSKEIKGKTDEEGWLKESVDLNADVQIELADGRVIRVLNEEERTKFEQSLVDDSAEENATYIPDHPDELISVEEELWEEDLTDEDYEEDVELEDLAEDDLEFYDELEEADENIEYEEVDCVEEEDTSEDFEEEPEEESESSEETSDQQEATPDAAA